MNSALMMLVDGRFPAGGHTNSAGVEAAVRLGDVHDDATLERYLVGRLATTGMVDAAFSAHVAALVDPTEGVLDEIDAEYASRVLSPRLSDASRRFGRQMLRAGATVWSAPMIDTIARSKVAVHQPVVLGALVAASGGTAHDAALVSFHHLSAAVTSAGVRLLGLDPMSVAAVQAAAGEHVDRWADDAAWLALLPVAELPANGGSLTEILAEDHGRWDARLFVA